MKIGFEYIKYRWKAKRRHGIHSPFIYELMDELSKNHITPNHKELLNNMFTSLSTDQTELKIDDHGAGSKKMNDTRRVSNIFKSSSSKGKYGSLLYGLANYFKPESILEFGTSLGVGTTFMQLGFPPCQITSVEACENTRKVALNNFKQNGLENIKSIHGTFNEYLQRAENTQFDLIFIDGHHDGQALLEYMDKLMKHSHNETIFVLDDIRWSESMLNSWNEIISSDRYHVTMDFFRMGIAIQRQEQEKEHFILRA